MKLISTDNKRLLGTLFSLALLPAITIAQTPIYMDQGAQWSSKARATFYTQDQGSQLIPLQWMMALRLPNGTRFMDDGLARFGFLPNPGSKPMGLPIGFTTNRDKINYLGMTCSACHTRQITVQDKPYRIDGGPAMIDFQGFMSELDATVGHLLDSSGDAFTRFAKEVLGSRDSKPARAELLAQVQVWYQPFHTITHKSLPDDSPWGPGRLDAISMIINRIAGLDIGPPPSYIIEENIKRADAPARYPFLWNATLQDFTQWPGFAENGNLRLGLSRNLGEVRGVFGKFHPQKDASMPGGMNYLKVNSANFTGLNTLELTIEKLKPPKWPWALDKALVAEGKKIYNKKDAEHENKSCEDCHGKKTGIVRTNSHSTWATPILDVGTDSRAIELLNREVQTGILEGVSYENKALNPVDKAVHILGLVAKGVIDQHCQSLKGRTADTKPSSKAALNKKVCMDNLPNNERSQEGGQYPYESRVLHGIWAAAPYLHNGSVPTLAELLKPSATRVAQFKVGPNYDINSVGLAADQARFNFTLITTDCAGRNSGNSRCGHEYGTTFSEAEKRALLEYLKQL